MTKEDHKTAAQQLVERRASIRRRLSEMQQHEITFSEFKSFGDDDQCSKELKLIAGVKERLPELTALLAEMNRDYEDGIYRFYHGSFKVEILQYQTERAVEIVLALAPNPALDSRFVEIMFAGTGKEFLGENREVEPDAPRHVVEAFFHARYFVEMLCKYGEHVAELEESLRRLVQIIARRKLEKPPYKLFEGDPLPSGWAAVLELFHLR